MEIKFLNVSLKERNKYIVKNLNLQIKSGKITGIYRDHFLLLSNILLNKVSCEGSVLIDNRSIESYEKNVISYIKDLDKDTFLTKTVSDEFYLVKSKIKEAEKGYIKKVVAALVMVGLDEKYLERNIESLSKSEKRLVQIALHLIINPDILLFYEPFLYLDKKAKFIITKILLDLKRKYKKTIILLSNDINLLYELTDDLVLFKDDSVLINDRTSLVFKDFSFLLNNNIPLPNIVLFNKIALTYNQKLSNSKDIKDLIKEVYKNVYKIKEDT